MAILIDGYNLLNETGVFPEGRNAGTLERARVALLDFLAETLDAEELTQTIIVFDAAEAPPGLPDRYDYYGMDVQFSRGYPEADVLLEELIQADSTPRKLIVVSSDHRLQRAARRRRARYLDSDKWYARLVARRRASRRDQEPQLPVRRELDDAELDTWINEFSDVDVERLKKEIEQAEAPPENPQATPEEAPSSSGEDSAAPDIDQQHAEHRDEEIEPIENPFPPGYAEDLFDSDEVNPFPPGYGEDLLDEDEERQT